MLLFACNEKEKRETNSQPVDRYNLSIANEPLIFAIDSTTPNHSPFLSLYTDSAGREYLAYLSRGKGQTGNIQFFTLANQQLAKRIPVAVEGPDGVGDMRGFYVRDLDNVYIAASSTLSLAHVNQEGRIKNKVNYAITSTGRSTFPTIVGLRNPVMIRQGELLLPMTTVGSWLQMTQAQLLEWPLCLAIDTGQNRVEYLAVTFPSDYWQVGRKDALYSNVQAGVNYVYAFLGDPHLYVTRDFKQVDKHLIGSRFFEEVPPQPKDMAVDSYVKHMWETPQFGNLLYDPYQEVYYWFTSLGEELPPGTALPTTGLFPPQVSIIIVGEDFKKLGEVKLPRNRFAINNAFVAKAGLYLSDNHPQNPQAREDALSFTRLDLVKIDQ
ncbi:MAG: DUF4221 domain-containing protein [Bernardetiaceae bacterium]|nr:DUF4221 domain-containing protein [Bernardetiaceae bacterium]